MNIKTIKIFFLVFSLSPFLFALETTIKGGKMELREKGQTLFFSDGVRMERGSDVLKASEMETNNKRDKINAKGNVELFRKINSSETCRGYGSEGFYNTPTGDGFLMRGKDQAKIVYNQIVSSTQTRTLDMLANRFDFTQSASTGIASGNVYGKTIDPDSKDLYEFWAEKAEYFAGEKKVILSGTPQPHVLQTNGELRRTIKGNKITYFLDSKKMISEGDSVAIFVDPQEKEKQR